jgi:WD40 repeat protein
MDKISKSSISSFTEKVIISTSKEDKKIFLWDENNRSIIYTYEDQNIKTFIPTNKLKILGPELFSEYILTLQENKSLITIWKTNASEPFLKATPIEERITAIHTTDNNKLLLLGTETGNLYIHELFTGNQINKQIASDRIIDIKVGLKDSMLFCLTESYFKVVSFEK